MAKKLMIDRTFVRVDKQNKSIRELTHEEYKEWYVNWFTRYGSTLEWGDDEPVESAPEVREADLQLLVDNDMSPVMLIENYDEEPG